MALDDCGDVAVERKAACAFEVFYSTFREPFQDRGVDEFDAGS
jgi:hypothetical protein